MLNQSIHQFFPFKKLLKLLLSLVILVQLIVITYNHLSGYYTLSGIPHFFIRLSRGTLLSLIGAFLIAYPDLYLIRYLNKRAAWNKKLIQRIIIQFSFTVLLAFIIAILITLFANWISAYTEDLDSVLISNALIYAVVNIILMILLEAWLFFMENAQSKEKAQNLEKELSQIKYEVLKNQINPHFMFNSLNVLSGLIEKDTGKAQQFVDEFATIYRYVLETIEKPIVSLNEELGFVRSYFFLQRMRYGESLILNTNIPAELLSLHLPPLSLQVVLENAIKHNIVNQQQPLTIEIYNDNSWLMVRNNLQKKISQKSSTGLGQKNIIKRYAMLSEEIPKFIVETNHYSVKLPLIDIENEDLNY